MLKTLPKDQWELKPRIRSLRGFGCGGQRAWIYMLKLTNKLNQLWRLVFEAVKNGCLFLVRSLPSEDCAQRG